MMRTLFLCLMSASLSFAGIQKDTSGTSLVVSERFESPAYSFNARHEASVKVGSLPNTIEAGLPSVPVKNYRVLIPAGFEYDGVSVNAEAPELTKTQIANAGSMVPLSWSANPPKNLVHTAAPTIGGESFPASHAEVNIQTLHGLKIALINLYPVVALKKGGAEVLRGIQLKVNLKPSTTPCTPLFAHQIQEVQSFVDNSEELTNYGVPKERANYDYLVISEKTFINYNGENSFSALQNDLTSRGLNSKVVDVASILAKSDGATGPDKVRNYIRQEYQTNGVRYVLLASKGKTIPAVALWSKIKAYFGNGWVDIEEKITSDFYYSALDGTFDGNKNGIYGEPNDGEGGGDVDFLPEVTVGRVAMDSVTDLQNFVRKTVSYAHRAGSHKALLMGEDLFPELHLTGGDYMAQLVGVSEDHGFKTQGFTSNWEIETLYDGSRNWTGAKALQTVSEGDFSMVNHLGHSNVTYNMRLNSGANFQNAVPYFYYTQGCLAGKYTASTRSFVDRLVTDPHAAAAAVGNWTYGLAPEDPTPSTTTTPGGSQMLNRQFMDAIFTKGILEMGRAHQYSKEAFVHLKNAQEVRWITWTATYFGDPSLPAQK